ncbi:relaxase/mobilization nuclease domain-containing protein [Frigidibacter mobilis]|uniref:Relaxase/mobilization nuclease family protein n=1 Tax=Frigidibacter mobilis TaxID=1335048 RepID=A0A161GXD7_9RHOB|nr:relaxase/mobilization nuclease domain-containing protein [Frigidibacter mobilis]AMY72129.1 relaxase/mobilization nuclease family protein [Frigidibacter mobilis]
MIVKGGSRGGPQQLADHLRRTDTNERVEVLELHAGTDDLAATFRDWQVLSEATRGSKGLYHVNIDPDARYVMTPDQWARAVEVLEQELGLTGQPRAVVMHEKKGRQHIHVVWARTDLETMTLRDDGFNYDAHERASLRMEQEFGHEHVPGKHAKRDREKQPDFPRAEITHAEWQQAERAALSIDERKAQITAIKESCDSGPAFRAALDEAGYVLARGDRRGFVLVDAEGEVHVLGRQIGMRAAEVKAFMADVDMDALPSVAEAREHQEARQAAPVPEAISPDPAPPAPEASAPEKPALSAVQMDPPPIEDLAPAPEARKPDLDPAPLDPLVAAALAAREREEADKLAAWHAAETRQLERALLREVQDKLKAQDALDAAERRRFEREMKEKQRGILGYIEALQNRLNPGRGAELRQAREQARQQLHARQEIERRDMQVLWEQTKAQELEALAERHAQQMREQAGRFEEDRKRYAEDTERSRRLLERIEEERRLRERQEQERWGRGDPPGGGGRTK